MIVEPITSEMNVAKKEEDPKKVGVKVQDMGDLPKQEDIKAGVPGQEPPTAGPTARIDGDPNKPGEKL